MNLYIKIRKKIHFPIWRNYFSHGEQIILALLVLLGISTRVINAISTRLWRDEIYIFYTSKEYTFWQLLTQQHWDTAHPPLHSILLHFWQLISFHPFWLRLPSITASLAILYLVPVLAVRIMGRHNKFYPFISLFLFSISHTQISLTTVVRPYPFVILLTIVSLLLLSKIMEEQLHIKRNIVYFSLVNWALIFFDYSALWLFFSYAIFFIFYFFLHLKKIGRVTWLFRALVLSALCCVTVLPYLLSNLKQSLYLERNIQPIKMDENMPSISSDDSFYMLIKRNEKKVFIYDKLLHKLSEFDLSSDPFPHNKMYLGYNVAPLSSLFIKELSYCGIANGSGYLKEYLSGCKFERLITASPHESPGNISKLLFIYSSRNLLSLINLKNVWQTPNYDKGITLTNSNMLIKIRFSSLHILEPNGINIIGQGPINGSEWWKGISRFTIFQSGSQYEIEYYDGQSAKPLHVFGESGILERLSGDIRFFVGIPYIFITYIYLLVALALLLLSQASNLLLSILKKNFMLFMMFLLFCIPLSLSFLISYFYAPIFVGRNLYVVNISYLFGISLFISSLFLSNRTLRKIAIIIGIIMLLFFIRLFVSQFPYLHYVDPPYRMGSVVKAILRSPLPNKFIITGNSKEYSALFRYELLLLGNSIKIPLSSVNFLMSKKDTLKRMTPKLKREEDIFFVEFGSMKNVGGSSFSKISTLLDCKIVNMSDDYIYFAKCE